MTKEVIGGKSQRFVIGACWNSSILLPFICPDMHVRVNHVALSGETP